MLLIVMVAYINVNAMNVQSGSESVSEGISFSVKTRFWLTDSMC